MVSRVASNRFRPDRTKQLPRTVPLSAQSIKLKGFSMRSLNAFIL